MSFWSTARHSAASEYGRVRAEKYGRWAKVWRAVQFLAALVLCLLIFTAYEGRFGG